MCNPTKNTGIPERGKYEKKVHANPISSPRPTPPAPYTDHRRNGERRHQDTGRTATPFFGKNVTHDRQRQPPQDSSKCTGSRPGCQQHRISA